MLYTGYQVLLFLLPACIGFYLATHRFFVDFFAVFLILAVCVTCMTTIIGCIAHPDAARVLATTKSSQDPLAILYEMQNIGGYGFVYSTVLLYPFVILAYKMKKLHPDDAVLAAVFRAARYSRQKVFYHACRVRIGRTVVQGDDRRYLNVYRQRAG